MQHKNMNFRKSSLRRAKDKSSHNDAYNMHKKLGKSHCGSRTEDGVYSSVEECSYVKSTSQSDQKSTNWTAEERRRKSYSVNWSPKMADLVNKFDRAHVATQQQLCMQETFLRHRKISTQLKVESLERQLELEQQLLDKKRQQRTPSALCDDGAEERLRELKNELQAADEDLKEMEKFGQQKLKDIENRKADTLQAWTALEQVAMGLGTSQPSGPSSSPSIVISHCEAMDFPDEPSIGSYVFRRASDTPMSENEAAKMKNMANMDSNFNFTRNIRQSQDDTAITGGNKRRGRWKPFSSMRFIGIKPFRRVKSADVLNDETDKQFQKTALETNLLTDIAIGQHVSDSECDVAVLKSKTNGNIEQLEHLEPRTSISPESLAEIEAFENFITDFFQRT